jgi:hypothetical protein
MGTQTKEVGGGPATGLANDFVKFLQSGLNSGTFGGLSGATGAMNANPFGSTNGIAGVLNDILSGGAGKLGGSLQELIGKQETRDVNDLRARFGASGGTAFGTPAAYAESLLRSETAPKLTQAVGGLQLQTLSQLLPLLAGLSQRGISQRETVQQPSPLANAFSIAAPVIGAFAGGPAGGALGSLFGGMFGGGGMPSGPVPNPYIPSIPDIKLPSLVNFPNFGY